ncbi:hypothetical protein MTR67_004005 [Solanum verrucosum]|uniref:Uncharacterized protein n=1 Tax=Solanum verrucosum TaxID=315347 RepID=A0AAF0PWR8_SOLVR|nr:hypothetical protein MTR67_004005 [Solanum verrucosum]
MLCFDQCGSNQVCDFGMWEQAYIWSCYTTCHFSFFFLSLYELSIFRIWQVNNDQLDS